MAYCPLVRGYRNQGNDLVKLLLALPAPVVLVPADFTPGLARNGGVGQVLHRPASFFSCRTFFAWTLAASFRSAVWFLACSYKRRASRCSSGVLLGFGSFRGFSFLGLGFLTFLALLGFWLGSGLVSSKRCWKVLSSVRGWGATTASKRITPNSKGLSPRVRGNHSLFQSPAARINCEVYPRECGATNGRSPRSI